MNDTRYPATRRIAEFTQGVDLETIPSAVREHTVDGFVNWLGCTIGGSRHPASVIALDALLEFAGDPTATVLGRGQHVDALNTALINSLASAAHAFDDTHLATVIHPTGPVAAAALALAEHHAPVSGEAFVQGLLVGIEVSCQLAVALLEPPAQGQLGWYMTGVVGSVGAATAAARILNLSRTETAHAIGIAANQASGVRETHGSMCTSFVPGHAARTGMQAALFAAKGFTASESSIEGKNGFADVFSNHANLRALEALGERWAILDNAFKPYPCGIVIHPVIDACLELNQLINVSDEIERVDIRVNPLCLMLCDRPVPRAAQDAQVSVQHWAAAALVTGRAGLEEGTDQWVHDPSVQSLRTRIVMHADETLAREASVATLALNGNRTIARRIDDATGSKNAPMSRAAVAQKFAAQTLPTLGESRSHALLQRAQDILSIPDVSDIARQTVP
ncbi:MAG: MmgE/PrpD family protein [Pseudomonadota bacterium]